MLRTVRRTAFSIIELLVVVGIIAELVGIRRPSLGRARRQARITECASNLRQIAMGMNIYATQNEGSFPGFDMPSTGGNLWDVPHGFVNELDRMGISFKTFLCPASQGVADATASLNTYSSFNIIQYNVWIPRKNGSDIVPPSNNYAGSRFKIVSPKPAQPFAGPGSLGDTANAMNPIISDIIGSSSGVTPPANADASGYGNIYQISAVSNHLDGSRVVGVNQAFADGHVELKGPKEVHPYYLGNWWNWR
jgi:prepilin-type processing-associated H-X9-DG protein